MIQAHFSPGATIAHDTVRTRRIGLSIFWLLFATHAILFGTLLIVLTDTLLPARTPISAVEPEILRSAILTRLDGAFDDPLIEAAPGAIARASNIRGLRLNGVTYYYYFEGQRSFDPLSRGTVGRSAIEVVLRDESGPQTLVVYRLLRS